MKYYLAVVGKKKNGDMKIHFIKRLPINKESQMKDIEQTLGETHVENENNKKESTTSLLKKTTPPVKKTISKTKVSRNK